MATLTEEEEAK